VFAAPLAGVTVAGMKAQVIPVIGEQSECALLRSHQPEWIVKVNLADWRQ